MSTQRAHPLRSLDPRSNEALVEKYDAIRYAAVANAQSHPDRLATVAALHALLDGTRDRTELDAAAGVALGLNDPVQRRLRVDGYVGQFGQIGMLIR